MDEGNSPPSGCCLVRRHLTFAPPAQKEAPKVVIQLPEFLGLKSLPFREIIIYPWRVVYRVQNNTVEVLSVFDSRRDLEDILFERLTGSPRLP
ncbi:MAG: type II toxin-antitoxin system RelE/ParE family toxin [bacterium]|nr:type II toxin-antitoxin system RelE/ParE family toxin [bacterium]